MAQTCQFLDNNLNNFMEIGRCENLCSFTILAPKVVEYNVTSTRSLLGLCSFKDGDYLSEFARAEQKK